LKIIFMGTPEFSVPCLKMLIEEGYEIPAVITQPDKPKGRGKKLCAPPVKEFALSCGINVYQPEKVKTKEFVGLIRSMSPDLIIVVAYGKILSKRVLDIPRLGCINVHASLLPKYRGAAPYQWAIINGEKVTGITTMLMDEGMDTGDILLRREMNIPDDMTAGELHDKLSIMGAEILKETLKKLEMGVLTPVPQNNDEATYASMLNKDMGNIDWTKSARDICNLIRGTNPWPGAYTYLNGCRIRIWKAEIIDNQRTGQQPGAVVDVDKCSLIVECGKGTLKVLELQMDNCRKMFTEEYLCGHKINKGDVFVKE